MNYESDKLLGYWHLPVAKTGDIFPKQVTKGLAPAFQLTVTCCAKDSIFWTSEDVTVVNAQTRLLLEGKLVNVTYSATEAQAEISIAVSDHRRQPVAGAELLVQVLPEASHTQSARYGGIEKFYYGTPFTSQVITSDSFQFDFPHEGEYCCLPADAYAPRSDTANAVKFKDSRPMLPPFYFAGPSYWNATVNCDDQGVATVKIPLPSEIKNWKVCFVAIDAESHVSEASFAIRLTDKK